MNQPTPMMRHYLQLKEQHPQTILLFQLGEFYETFFEDAELAARELDIVLTQRDGTPMAGVPIKKAELYINRLLKRGHKVAVCDQMEDPSQAKGMVRREVVRVITPGTVLEEAALERGSNNFLVAVCAQGGAWAMATCDASTGEFFVASFSQEANLLAELAKLAPAELLLPEGQSLGSVPELERTPRTTAGARSFQDQALLDHFQLAALEGLGLSALEGRCAGGLLAYLKGTQKELGHLQRPHAIPMHHTLRLDPFTVRNLELVKELREGAGRATLLGVLNHALTGMGQRLLRQWLLNPLLDQDLIEARLDAVQALLERSMLRGQLRELLKGVYDVERLVGRLGAGRATPRDLLSLKQSLAKVPELQAQVDALLKAGPVAALEQTWDALAGQPLREVAQLLERALRDDAPPTVKEGGIIRPQFHSELEATLKQAQETQARLLALEAQERQTTGIASLKIGYNTVFGYFLEVPRTHAAKVPGHYVRKQTLSSAERYFTPQLKELEEKILAAQERARELEYRLFLELRERVSSRTPELQALAQAIARLDTLAALAHVAHHQAYTRPRFTQQPELDIEKGRHPVVELLLQAQRFVPNDLQLEQEQKLVVLTGPNMSGKSTYLRQVALIALMAQMGSFVPARSARLPLFDQIFTRVGASDMLAGGYSTFMVEMLETANILNNASARSLVLLDEMGRGTSTFDGVSIAWAVAEYLVKHVQAKTLFATHYHELTQMAGQLPGVVNMHVRVKEYRGDVIFLHEVAPGAAAGSYGVHVARLAGLPQVVIQEAEELLDRILAANPLEGMEEGKVRRGPRVVKQLALFQVEDHPIIQKLLQLDPNSLTPLEALECLQELKQQAQS